MVGSAALLKKSGAGHLVVGDEQRGSCPRLVARPRGLLSGEFGIADHPVAIHVGRVKGGVAILINHANE